MLRRRERCASFVCGRRAQQLNSEVRSAAQSVGQEVASFMARTWRSSEQGAGAEHGREHRARVAPARQTRRDQRAYDSYLSDLAVGDYGQVDPAPEERPGAMRRRLHAAATRRGLALRFRPGPRAALILRVTALQ
jgi:hypothetical protein